MDLNDLLEEIDIVDFIGQYVELEQKAGGEWWGLSPFKDEKTPSFSVRKETGSWYDFSSSLAGNAYTFARFYFKCTNAEAVRILENYAGVNLDKAGVGTQRLAATRICKMFAEKQSNKKISEAVNVSQNTMDKFRVDRDMVKTWEDEGISWEVMQRFDVRYDDFSNRIVYPIRDASGAIRNVGGRTLDTDWKEKGLRKYTYFYKWGGAMDLLYGLYENYNDIVSSREIILFEGCKSVLKAASWGINNTAAVLTSHISPNQLAILIGLGAKVVVAFDNDVDVSKDYNMRKLLNYTRVDVIHDKDRVLEEKDSPVDKGEAVFRKLYEERRRLM